MIVLENRGNVSGLNFKGTNQNNIVYKSSDRFFLVLAGSWQ